jgi:hypothetical protein
MVATVISVISYAAIVVVVAVVYTVYSSHKKRRRGPFLFLFVCPKKRHQQREKEATTVLCNAK